jgi:hypothetical protein
LLTVNGAPYAATLSSVSDEDWYRFIANGSGPHTMQTFGGIDTVMTLRDSTNHIIAQNDDSGTPVPTGWDNALITYSLTDQELYYITVRAYGAVTLGYGISSYTVSVSSYALERTTPAPTTTTPRPITLSGTELATADGRSLSGINLDSAKVSNIVFTITAG